MAEKKNKGINKVEVLKLLLESSFKEANLFWIRNNLFIISNIAAFGIALKWGFSTKDPAPDIAMKIMSFIGLCFCIIWFMFNSVGRRMNHVWMEDAKVLVKSDDDIKMLTQNAFGEDTPSEAAGSTSKLNIRFKSATYINYLIIILFGLAWFTLFLLTFRN
jgi:hypothetical protein